jgi:hypothetical protein
VPPAVHKTFWVESERVSSEYLEQMGYFLMQLTLNVTPQSVDHQAKVLLQYASPGASGELRTALLAAAERLKRDGASTVFSAQDLVVDERAASRRARAAHHIHQRPARVGSLEGLMPSSFSTRAVVCSSRHFVRPIPMTPLKTSLVLLPLLLSNPASALQILDAKDGETVLGKISQKEVTRISFERGRIRKVTGNAGEFVLEKDEEKGQISSFGPCRRTAPSRSTCSSPPSAARWPCSCSRSIRRATPS